MRTIREHLNSLPEPYRTEAFNNIIAQKNTDLLDLMDTDIKQALLGAFEFGLSKEGLDYWAELYSSITDIEPIESPSQPQSEPPIPTNRSDSIGKDAAINKSVWVNHLFKNWNDTSFSLNILHFGPPYFVYDHDKF